MKHFNILLSAGLIVIAFNLLTAQTTGQTNINKTEVQQTKEGVFIHITEGYNNPQRVLMPLKMATLMANDKDVIIYMDLKAIDLLVKGAKDMTYTNFESLQTYLKMLTLKHVKIYACPTCLKIAGFGPADLADGVEIAKKDLFDFTKGRTISMNY